MFEVDCRCRLNKRSCLPLYSSSADRIFLTLPRSPTQLKAPVLPPLVASCLDKRRVSTPLTSAIARDEILQFSSSDLHASIRHALGSQHRSCSRGCMDSVLHEWMISFPKLPVAVTQLCCACRSLNSAFMIPRRTMSRAKQNSRFSTTSLYNTVMWLPLI